MSDDRPEGHTNKLRVPSARYDEEHIYPVSYDIANPIPPIPSAQHNDPLFSYSNHSMASHVSSQLYTNSDVAPVADTNHLNNDDVISLISNLNNDRTHLLQQNYVNDQHRRLHHSYLSSPGRTVASCNNKSIHCSLRSIITNIYALIIVMIDYIILPTSVVLLLLSMAFMIIRQCSNEILNEWNQAQPNYQVTSNCQCVVDLQSDEFDDCICVGIHHRANIEHYGFISLFYSVLLVFIMEYLSIIFLLFYVLCKCVGCGNALCCTCWRHLKLHKGYYVYLLVRSMECAVCWYFMHTNSRNVHCQCQSQSEVEYCGPWHLDTYMEYLWLFCGFYGGCCAIFITGRIILACLIKDHRKQSFLIRMVRYKI